MDERSVQKCERLRPGRRDDSLLATAGGVGRVEQLDFRNSQAALGEDIDAAPGLFARRRICPSLARARTGLRARRREAWDRTRGRPSSGSSGRSTARIESRTTSASRRRCRWRQSNVLSGSTRGGLGVECRRSLVSLGQHDQPVQRLEPPAAGHQFRGQPVEQLGMSGLVAHDTQIVCRGNEPAAEVGLPDPVGDARARPAGFPGSSASGPARACGRSSGRLGLGLPGCFANEHGRQPRLGHRALLVRVAALEHVSDRCLRAFLIPDVGAGKFLVRGLRWRRGVPRAGEARPSLRGVRVLGPRRQELRVRSS